MMVRAAKTEMKNVQRYDIACVLSRTASFDGD